MDGWMMVSEGWLGMSKGRKEGRKGWGVQNVENTHTARDICLRKCPTFECFNPEILVGTERIVAERFARLRTAVI